MQIEPNALYNLCQLDGGCYAVTTISDAYDFCKRVASGHYENFPVASFIVSKKLRKHINAIYTFARIADDIADEISKTDNAQAALLLSQYKVILHSNKKTTNPIFLALRQTIEEYNLPINCFERLITAFEQDINFKQPENWLELLEYCNNSANPIGELLLHLFGECNDTTLHYSNCVCTALQLINFWQDLSIDSKRNRYYIPSDLMADDSTDIIAYIMSKTKNMMNEGRKILDEVYSLRFRWELRLIIFGGNYILRKEQKLGLKLLDERPKILI
jgi:phytoene synthase